MVMTSSQIGQMAYAQSAMFGGFNSYAQQITPPYGGRPGMGLGVPGGMPGYSPGPPPMPPPMMPQSGWQMPQYGGVGTMMMGLPNSPAGSYLPQATGERIAGAGFAGLSAGIGGLSTLSGVAGMAGMGMQMAGIGGGMATGLAAAGGSLPMAGLAAAGYAANQFNQGFQQHQQVGNMLRQNFGGMQIGGGGRGGYGFGAQQTGEISSMLREMGTADLGTNMEELTQVMGNMGKMKLMRGVQTMKEFQSKFRETLGTLKEIAQTMNTTLGEASEFMSASRQMGFFSGQDISRNLAQTRIGAGVTGMSVGQMQQIGQMGSQMGMSMGMRGRTGAGAAQNIATNIGLANQTGVLSDEMMFEATGGLTGAEGVQALTARTMQINKKWLNRGAGRVTLAAMWDPETGGINQDMMQKIQRGEISFQEARRIGRRNISKTGGRRSEFFSQQERIAGMAMEEGGMELAMGMVESHIGGRAGVDLGDPIVQRKMRRMLGMSQAEVEAFTELRRNMPRLNAERRSKTRQQVSEQMRNKLREHTGFSGFQRRMQQMWEREVDAPLQQIADDVTTSVAGFFEEMASEMEGRVRTEVSQQTKTRISDWARGKGKIGVGSAAEMSAFQSEMRRAGGGMGPGAGSARGMARSLGQFLGTRGPDMTDQLRDLKAYDHGLNPNASAEEREEWLNRWQRDVGKGFAGTGIGSKEQQELRDRALDLTYSSMSQDQQDKWIANRSNKEKAFQMAKSQIAMLRNNDSRFEKMFAGGSWAQKYGRLQALTGGEGGAGQLSVDFDAIGAGGSNQALFGTMEDAEAALEKSYSALEGISAEKAKKRTALQRAAGVLGDVVSSAGLGGMGIAALIGEDSMRKAAGRGREGIEADSSRRIFGNAALRADIEAAQERDSEGNPTAAAKEARTRLQRTAMREEGAKAPHQIRAEDRGALNKVIKMVTEGTQEQKDAIKSITSIHARKEQSAVFIRAKKAAQDLQSWVGSNATRLREGMGDEAYSAYQKVVDAQAAGNFNEARDLEEAFYRDHGGTPEGNFLLSNLRKAGAETGAGFQEGLASMADWEGQFRGARSDKARAKKLLDMTLERFGIRNTRKLLGGKMMGEISGVSSDEEAEEVSARMWERLSKKQKRRMADLGHSKQDLLRAVQEDVRLGGEGGVTEDELRGRRATQGVQQAYNTRVGGQPKEEIDTPKQSLAQFKKMNMFLEALVRGNKDTLAALAAVEKAAGEGGGGGDGETKTPGRQSGSTA